MRTMQNGHKSHKAYVITYYYGILQITRALFFFVFLFFLVMIPMQKSCPCPLDPVELMDQIKTFPTEQASSTPLHFTYI